MRLFVTLAISFSLFSETLSQTTYNHYDYDAIVVGDVVSGRDMASTDGKLVNSLVLGQQVEIVGESHWKDIIIGDDTGECEEYGYSWLEVENLKKEKSWMYGKYLFQKDRPFENEMIGQVVRYKNQDWYFGLASSLSIGSSTEDGPTGCDRLQLPYLYKENEEKIYPIIIEEESDLDGPSHIRRVFDGNLFMLADGDGGSSTIANVSVEDESFIQLSLDNVFQDGGNEITVSIDFDGDKFVLRKVANSARD